MFAIEVPRFDALVSHIDIRNDKDETIGRRLAFTKQENGKVKNVAVFSTTEEAETFIKNTCEGNKLAQEIFSPGEYKIIPIKVT